jgi:hypothetical protein
VAALVALVSRLDLSVALGSVVVIVLLLLSDYALTVVAWTLVVTGATFIAIAMIARLWVRLR